MEQITQEQALGLLADLNEAGFDALVETNPRGVNMYNDPGGGMLYIVSARIDSGSAKVEDLAAKLTRCSEIGQAYGLQAWFASGHDDEGEREAYGMRVVFET